MINRFIIGHGVVIYFIKQSVLKEIANNYLVILSKRGNLQSVILFMLSTAAAIIMQTKLYEISARSKHSVVKLNFSRLSVCLHNAPPQRLQMTSHNVTFIDVISALYRCVTSKSECGLYVVS